MVQVTIFRVAYGQNLRCLDDDFVQLFGEKKGKDGVITRNFDLEVFPKGEGIAAVDGSDKMRPWQ